MPAHRLCRMPGMAAGLLSQRPSGKKDSAMGLWSRLVRLLIQARLRSGRSLRRLRWKSTRLRQLRHVWKVLLQTPRLQLLQPPLRRGQIRPLKAQPRRLAMTKVQAKAMRRRRPSLR